MKGQQKSPDAEVDLPTTVEGTVAIADDPAAASTVQTESIFADQQIKYLLKTDANTGQMTYRVIHLAEGQMDAQADGASAVSVVTGLPVSTRSEPPIVTQAVFSQAEGLGTNLESTESQFYYPATIPNTSSGTIVTNVHAADSLLTQATSTSQLYVMMSPQELLGNTHDGTNEIPHSSRDNKRRAQHNEVERRRRDKINNWIVQLSKTIPDCSVESAKSAQSKGGILSKACNYIQELRQSNARLSGGVDTLDRLRIENQRLRKEAEELKSKNQMLRNHLEVHNIVTASSLDP